MATAMQPDNSPLEDLNSFRRDLLAVVCGMDDPSGQDIMRELGEYYGTEINHGRLYPALDDLKRAGLIEKGELDRRTNYYSATRRGRREARSDIRWRQEQMEGDA